MAAKNSETRRSAKPEPAGTGPDTFAERVRQYPDGFLECRDYGHSWRPVTVTRLKDGTYLRQLACSVCKTTRTQQLDRSGYIMGSSYSYRSGYLISGAGRLSTDHRAVLRLESLTRGVK